MAAALSARDLATAERTAHSLKGAAGTIGAVALSQAAATAETAIKNGEDVQEAVEALSLVLDEAVKAIAAALPDPGPFNGAPRASMDSATINVVSQPLEASPGER
jgi:HPt (histidine-containing phosphotransfer) domain-containing protein